jgi:hypothetical protein
MSRRSLQAVGAGCRAEQARAGDALQRPLRSRFQALLTPSVRSGGPKGADREPVLSFGVDRPRREERCELQR